MCERFFWLLTPNSVRARSRVPLRAPNFSQDFSLLNFHYFNFYLLIHQLVSPREEKGKIILRVALQHSRLPISLAFDENFHSLTEERVVEKVSFLLSQIPQGLERLRITWEGSCPRKPAAGVPFRLEKGKTWR